MTVSLPEIIGLSQRQLLVFFLVFLRVGAALALLPVLGERSVPMRIRLGLALILTVIVTPAVTAHFDGLDTSAKSLIGLLFSEAVFGLAIGFSLRLFVLALQVAGAIAAQSTSLSQVFAGASIDPQAAFGNVLLIGGLALAVTIGLHVRAAEYLIYSYDVFDPGQPGMLPDIASWSLANVARAFGLAFSLAAPFVVASLVYNIALGAINKAMPQLLVSFVGAPAITAGGLVLLLITAPLMFSVWRDAIGAFLANPFAGGS